MGEDMKRLVTWAVAAVTAAALLIPVRVEGVSAEKAVVMDAVTGRVLYERNAQSQSLIASTTKIMTAYVVCRRCNVLDRFRIPKEAVGIEGSSMYLQEGEVLTVQELLYGLMLHSGNDAAVALAIYCGGTVEGFVDLMNEQAAFMGLKNTHFSNPHGLDAPDHYSTALDLAKLTSKAMEDPVFARTVSTKSVRMGERSLHNHNKLLWRVEGADGVKTGYTKAAGRILVSSAVRQGRRLIAVTINAPDDWNDHVLLLNNGFHSFRIKRLINMGTCLGYTEVAGGQAGFVELIATEDFEYALSDGEEANILLPGSGFVYAPVCSGQDAGDAKILVNGCCVGSVKLAYGQTVEQLPDEKISLFHKILNLVFGKEAVP